jgi:anti-sigma B factor antagonist
MNPEERGEAGHHWPGSMHVVPEPDRTVIRLIGEIDLTLQGQIDAIGPSVRARELPVVIDASAMTFIDSTGLRILLMFMHEPPGGRAPVVTGAPPQIIETMEVMGLSEYLDFT